MKLVDVPLGMTDWSGIAATIQAGASGTATARSRVFGEMQLRIVEYSAGYVADHWCAKGHILFVVAGALAIEHRDGSRYELAVGTTWHVADDSGPPHRVVCLEGATVLIID